MASRTSSANVKAAAGAPYFPWAPSMAPFSAPAARATLAGIDVLQANLRAWRGVADAVRTAIRDQQDMMLRAAREQLGAAAGTAGEANGPDLIFPFVAAQKACEQMGDAVLAAQRNAIEAWVAQEGGAQQKAH